MIKDSEFYSHSDKKVKERLVKECRKEQQEAIKKLYIINDKMKKL